MAPLHDDDQSAARSPLDAFAECASIAIGEVEPKHERAIRAALDRLQREAREEDRSINRALSAVDGVRAAFDQCATSDRTAFAERLDDAASCDERFVSDAGWVWILEGRARLDRSEHARAIQAIVRGTTLLSRRTDSVDRNRYTVGLRYHARAVVDHDVDSALELLGTIVEIAQQTGDKNIRNRALGCTRDLAELIYEERPQDAVAICDRALALDRAQPSQQTWLGVLDCNNARALALRKLGRIEDALVACEQSVQLADERDLRGEDVAGSVAWALCEGAFIAAELSAQPDRALRLVAALRARSGPIDADTDEVVVAELAYAISMEARSWLSKDQPERALTACDEAITLAKRSDDDGSRGAHAAALRLRGEALIALRRPSEAREAWTLAVERFIDDAKTSVRDEAIRARAKLSAL